MNSESIACDVSDLTNPGKGYAVKRAFLSPGEADAYRAECEEFLANSTAIYKKFTDTASTIISGPKMAKSSQGYLRTESTKH
jgi:hypothetical protein